MKKYAIWGIVFMLFLSVRFLHACTTAVVSGKATPDGRPILYKNRDTQTLHSRLIYSTQGKYSFIGMVNPMDIEEKSVLNGHNSAGFAIINSDSYNINYPALKDEKRQDGEIMRLALETCATLEDFENLLNHLSKPLRLSSNFGVIDAKGGAAYYETNNTGFTKFDANDPIIAPFGYIIRTNYSFSGLINEGKGYSRYMQAQELLYNASLNNNLTPRFFLQDVSKCLVHGLTKVNLNQYKEKFAAFRDFIPRYFTASAVVFQGVKTNESPSLTTAWTILGSTLGSVTIPLWLNNKHILPKILIADKQQKTLMDEWASCIKKKLFPIERGEGNDYINVEELLKILPKIYVTENNIFKKSEKYLDLWRKNGRLNEKEITDFYQWIDDYVPQLYLE
ncbi:carcinine hydrolase/isopenicillin-N N-acyltransferase family protein [Apibacter adventoris]|uniref:carcinine hydrolase/isopenicillin-N N-acyltransferase family protein n=1 Tax=Apibacter adventoris TaxID=1679466 RepID=UPI000CF707A5|nr:carcinine hydrolase/isopenicillin-N N-acyltransferase family protein [Apibacter adventoris]PQL93532.1 hypothetical protein C4S76_07765 [Apibacter adventoris]